MKTNPQNSAEDLKKLFPFEPHYFPVKNVKLHYIDEGTGPLLVLMHACPMWSFFFRNIIQEFSKTHRVIAIDQMGFGLSDKPIVFDYRIESHIDHFERLVAALDLKDMTLIMHGRGTSIGMGYAVKHPHNVRGFITLNAMAFSNYSFPWRLQICRLRWLGAKLAMKLGIFLSDIRRLPPNIAAAYQYPFPDKDSRIALLRFVEQIPCAPEDDSAMSMFEIESGLWLLNDRPACIIWAMKDWLYKSHDLKKWISYFPNAELYKIDRGSRFLAEEAPEEFSAIIRNFLVKNGL